MINPSIITCK